MPSSGPPRMRQSGPAASSPAPAEARVDDDLLAGVAADAGAVGAGDHRQLELVGGPGRVADEQVAAVDRGRLQLDDDLAGPRDGIGRLLVAELAALVDAHGLHHRSERPGLFAGDVDGVVAAVAHRRRQDDLQLGRLRRSRCTRRARRPCRCRPSRRGPSSRWSPSSHCVTRPDLTMIISSWSGCLWKSWPKPGSSATSMTTNVLQPVPGGAQRMPALPQSKLSVGTSLCHHESAHRLVPS